MTTATDLGLARAAFDRRAWSEAAERLHAADAAEGLGTEDLERLATARHMLGQPDEAAFQYDFTSMLVTGVGRDANYVVSRIAERARAALPDPATATATA